MGDYLVSDLSIGSISSMPKIEEQANGLDSLGSDIFDQLKSYETYMQKGITPFQPHGEATGMPGYVSDYINKLRNETQDPLMLQKVERLENKIKTAIEKNDEFMQEKIVKRGEKLELEFSIYALKKSVSAIQQLLSAQ